MNTTDNLLNLIDEIRKNINMISEEKKQELYNHLDSVYRDKPIDKELVKYLFLGWYVNETYMKNIPSID